MKRKRFVKILMCLGLPRNEAAATAAAACKRYGSYMTGLASFVQLCKKLFPDTARVCEITHPHIFGICGGGEK